MKKVLKIIGIILIVLIVLIVVILGGLNIMSKKVKEEQDRKIKDRVFEHIIGVNDIEAYYSDDIHSDIDEYHEKVNKEDVTEYVVYYPKDLKGKYPVVIWSNGSLGTYKDYEGSLKSLASYGFIVVGNNHEQTGSGKSIYATALYALELNSRKDSIFYEKIDADNIGIGGHSQGGCGAVNGATKYEKSKELFKSLFTTSMPKKEMIDKNGRNGYWDYDVSLITMPYFATAGTGSFDNDVAPLSSLENNMNNLPKDIEAYIALKKDEDHNLVNKYHACGYMNAWFSYTLKNEEKAKEIFVGTQELKTNTRWHYFKSNQ